MNNIKVVIVGAGGYGGCGAIELLLNHPRAEVVALIDKAEVGKPISSLYPHLKGFCDLPVLDPEDGDLPKDADVVYFSTPDGVGQKAAAHWLEKGMKVIDYSGDFRFNDAKTYEGYASRIGRKKAHAAPELLPQSVYGLAELHREDIQSSSLVGNPGCFAVSCTLGLAPAVEAGLIDTETIICDAKTGVSGAGKNPNPAFHYPARYDAINAYKISGHQHVYEIERELGIIAGRSVRITFTPHVVPMSRGILSTLYGKMTRGKGLNEALNAYEMFYHEDPFVRVFGPEAPQISTHVRGSNFCNISVNLDERTGNLIIVSLIDNLVKGQAGSAVQNMNIMFGLEETEGLLRPGMYP
ncbi:MAG: N-acetyl-gamma-glutamyl-phosphate reductase [Deltaproteobacteria bacterium]|nr:N-acetyl-gamma-glutamyl-phosphate reductase [Deltaproteobacteria bacterium]